MKNFLIICILLSFTNYTISQKNSGKVTYSVETFENLNDSISFEVGYSEFRKEINNIAKDLSFELLFDQDKAVFGLVKFLPLDKNDSYVSSAIMVLSGDETYYTNTKNKKLFEDKTFLGKDFMVETTFDALKWELLNESKIIDGYICYKAVRNRIATGRDFKKTSVSVYAWYCPEIPLSIGPFEAVGLPGLVLEFRTPTYSYVLNKVIFNEKVILKEMPKTETITNVAFEEMVTNRAKKRMSID